jgi:hypothetical protein
MAQIEAATTAATFQLVVLMIVRSEGRFMAGPAISSARAAPTGAPAASKTKASGISKNVGSASGTANVATKITAMRFALDDAKALAGFAVVSSSSSATGSARLRSGRCLFVPQS